jgi:transcriptional regulator with XRE-family HTH domain
VSSLEVVITAAEAERGRVDAVPFRELMRRAMTTDGVTFRALSVRTRECDPERRGLTHGYLAAIAGGGERPTARSMSLISAALDLDPTDAIEHRLECLRQLFDERRVGPEEATRRLILLARFLAPQQLVELGFTDA